MPRDTFSGYHPLVNFLFFALVLLLTMCLLHPVSLGISLLCALAYCFRLTRKRTVLWLLPTAALAALLNPLFNHRGATILTYLPSGNPLTLESILYGLAAGGMLAAVLAWFACCTVVLSADKFLFLFGRVAPALSLLLSMTLGFVPKFQRRLRTVLEAQQALGQDLRQGGPVRRLRRGLSLLSILLTWSLEDAVQTADSMKGRGYGLPGRSAYTPYRLERRDRRVLLWFSLCAAVLLLAWAGGVLSWHYFPQVDGALSPWTALVQGVCLALCATPLALDHLARRAYARSLQALSGKEGS